MTKDARPRAGASAGPPHGELPNEGQALFALYQHLRHLGVVVDLEQVINIYLSLKTVPVVVLDGPSGAGKNLLIRQMAHGMGARFFWMPMTNESGVGPADAPLRLRDLLGQMDPHTGRYRPEPWYDALFYAHQHPDRAVVICLDTLDGWQEDSWLSEYMRLQDSRTQENRWVAEPLVAVPGCRELETVDGRRVPGAFPLPDNVFLAITTMGTANLGGLMVERTNVVAVAATNFSLEALRPGHAPEVITPRGLGKLLVSQRRYRSVESILERRWIGMWNAEIEQLATILEEADLPIGYRVRDEILRYLAYADDLNAQLPYGARFPLEIAFDYQIAQRIVPRLLLREPDEEVLTELLMYTQGQQGNMPRFPRATAYLEALQRRME